MKLSTLVVLLGIAISLLPTCFASTSDQPIIIYDSHVNDFIYEIGFHARFAADANGLASKGYVAYWPGAIAEIINFPDDRRKPQSLKIFAIPFINGGGTIISSVIGGIIQSDEAQPHDFLTTANISAALQPQIIPSSGEKSRIISKIDIKPLIGLIAAGNRPDIWNYIIQDIGIKPSSDPGEAVRAAFESNGYACSIPPSWFPRKAIWYGATCINKAH